MPTKLFIPALIAMLLLSCEACHQKNNELPVAVVSTKDSVRAEPIRPSYFSATGTLVIPSTDIVSITSPASGLLKSFSFTPGSYVKKGEVLGVIENIEFLKLQQQFLEAKSEFVYYREDLKRQGGLAIENATSVKKMQQAQRDFQTSEIRFRSLEKQLALIGFNTDSLDADHLASDVVFRATVSGYVDKLSLRTGSRFLPGETILVLVKKYEPVIAFEIPEESYPKLKSGDPVDFYFPGDSLVIYKARVTFINRQTDPGNHLVKARAIPLKSSPAFIPGMQVRVQLPL